MQKVTVMSHGEVQSKILEMDKKPGKNQSGQGDKKIKESGSPGAVSSQGNGQGKYS